MRTLLLIIISMCFFNLSVQNDGASINFTSDGGFNKNQIVNESLRDQISTSNKLSMSVWVKPTIVSTGQQMHIVGFDLCCGNRFSLNLDSRTNNVRFFFPNGGSRTQFSAEINVWQHIAITFDGDEVKVYKNGILIFSRNDLNVDQLNLTGPLYIGSTNFGNNPFVGSIDEVSIWKKALTNAEIVNLYQNPIINNPVSETDLLLYYNFNEGIPKEDNTGINEVEDLSVNEFNGELRNFSLVGNTSNFDDNFMSNSLPASINNVCQEAEKIEVFRDKENILFAENVINENTIKAQCLSSTTKDLWYAITIPELFKDTKITVSDAVNEQNNFVPTISAYSGNCDGLTSLACSSTGVIDILGQESGDVIYLQVSSADTGYFSLSARPIEKPNNQLCEAAIPLTVGTSFDDEKVLLHSYDWDEDIANSNIPEPECSNYYDKDGSVWYTVVTPESGNLVLETKLEHGTPDAIDIQVYTGSCSAGLIPIACEEGYLTTTLNLKNRTPGEILYVRFFEYDSSSDDTFFRVSAYDPETTLWTGAIDKNWSTAANWNNGVPTVLLNTIIPNVNNKPIINAGVFEVRDLEIQAGASLTINSTGKLTIERDLSQNGDFIVNSDENFSGTLILKGELNSGKVTYNRYVSSNWHLLSSPVLEQGIVAFKDDVVKSTDGERYGIAPYDNALSTSRYTYYTTSSGANDINNSGNFEKGIGYSMKRKASGVFSFTGALNTERIFVTTRDGTATSGNKWNLIGNPFTASVKANNNADGVHNFLSVNESRLDPARVAIYVWNASTASYDIINQATAEAKYIAPGQGFFVENKSGFRTIRFTEEMQSHESENVFSRGRVEEIPSIKINIAEGEGKVNKTTEIRYLNNTTVGLDIGHDAGVFSGDSSGFNVYTKLISEESKENFALQCLPNSNHESMIIPLGVTAKDNSIVSLSAKKENLPNGIKVYLEDKLKNKFIQIDKEEYKIILNKKENNIDRFYLHTSAKNISELTPFELNESNIFVTKDNMLNIINTSLNKKAIITVFSLTGKEVFAEDIVTKRLNELPLPKLSTGVYIVNMKSENTEKLSKKIIIK